MIQCKFFLLCYIPLSMPPSEHATLWACYPLSMPPSEHATHNSHRDSALLSASLIWLDVWNSISSVWIATSSSEGIVFLAREENFPPGRTVRGSCTNTMISLGMLSSSNLVDKLSLSCLMKSSITSVTMLRPGPSACHFFSVLKCSGLPDDKSKSNNSSFLVKASNFSTMSTTVSSSL